MHMRINIEGKHGPLLGLGEDGSTASWGGSTEATQPTGTLGDGREALLRMAYVPRPVGADQIMLISVLVACSGLRKALRLMGCWLP